MLSLRAGFFGLFRVKEGHLNRPHKLCSGRGSCKASCLHYLPQGDGELQKEIVPSSLISGLRPNCLFNYSNIRHDDNTALLTPTKRRINH